MNSIAYIESAEGAAVKRLIEGRRKYIEQQHERLAECDPKDERKRFAIEKSIQAAQSMLQDLQAIDRRLELTNDIVMNCIAEDIMEKIVDVRRDAMADKYVGIMVYYEMKPRWQWRDDGLNMVACVGNVKDWPFGEYNMTDLGDGSFVVDSDHPGPGCWCLGGKFVPMSIVHKEKRDDQ